MSHSHPHPSAAAELGPVRAPEFPEGLTWVNTDRPLSLARELRGHVVLLDFFSDCCVNCLHTLPELRALEDTFAGEPFAVVGVHSGKFTGEREPSRIAAAAAKLGIEHPVVVDADFQLWRAYTVSGWPTLALVDPDGYLVALKPGEPDPTALAKAVRYLLDEAKQRGSLAEGQAVFRRPGAASSSPLRFPGKVAALDGGRVAIADTGHHWVLVAREDGEVLHVAGAGREGFRDGALHEACFSSPQGLAGRGDCLWVADTGNHAIRKIDLARGTVETIAGTGKKGHGTAPAPDRAPRETHLRSPWDVALVEDDLFIAMAGSHQLWVLDLERDLLEIAAGSGREELQDGPSHQAALAQPSGLSAAGRHLFFADSETSSIRALDLETGEVATIVGEGLFDFGDVDGAPNHARFQHPLGVTALGEHLFVADTYNGKVRRISLRSGLTDSLTRAPGTLAEPGGIAAVGNRLLVADTNRHAISWVDPKSGALAPFELRFASAQVPVADPIAVSDLGVHAVSPGTHELVLTIELPNGFELNPEAKQKVAFLLDGERAKATLEKTPTRLVARAPVEVAEGQARVVEIDLALVLCTDKDKKLCLYDRQKLQAALRPTPVDSPREVFLRYVPASAM